MDFRVVGVAPDRRGLDPFGTVDRTFLFVKEAAFNPVRVTLQRQRAVFEMRQQDGSDADVIIDDLALGEPGFGIKDLVEVRQGKDFPVERQLGSLGRHQAASSIWAARMKSLSVRPSILWVKIFRRTSP